MRRLVLVRHGNTFAPGEPPRRIGRATDLPLVASGRAQAAALGERFAREGRRFDQVLAGPLRRTAETARLVLDAMGSVLPAVPVEWLAEIDHGPDEGRPEAEVVARIGQPALDRWDAEAVAPPGWRVDAEARLAAWRGFFAEQAAIGAGEALLVTSNGAARFALLAIGGSFPDPRVPSLAKHRPSSATPEEQDSASTDSGQTGKEERPSLKLRTGAYGEIVLDPAPRLVSWDQR